MIKATLLVVAKSIFFAALIIFINICSSHTIVDNTIVYNINNTLKEFIQKTALIILSFLYPIIITAYLSLRLYCLQQQSIILNSEQKNSSDKTELKNLYDAYDYVCKALLNIVTVLFWAFISYLLLNFIDINNIYLFYFWTWVQLSIFILFFFGLYQMIISTSKIFQPT